MTFTEQPPAVDRRMARCSVGVWGPPPPSPPRAPQARAGCLKRGRRGTGKTEVLHCRGHTYGEVTALLPVIRPPPGLSSAPPNAPTLLLCVLNNRAAAPLRSLASPDPQPLPPAPRVVASVLPAAVAASALLLCPRQATYDFPGTYSG